MRTLNAVLALAVGARAICFDDPNFLDELGQPCSLYASLASCTDAVGLTDLGLTRVLQSCQLSCNSCVLAADFCEIGLGGDQIDVPSNTAQFDFIDEPFLSSACEWIDTPAGLRQTTNAWGNYPGQNVLMGCMAILKNSFYTDFIMEVDARHDDNDASGIIFGMDPANQDMFYKTVMFNDDWMDFPTDGVQGPFLKISKRNGLPCLAEMTPDNDCYDMLAYSARDDTQELALYPNGRLSSIPYFPAEYSQIYENFVQHNEFGKTVKFTLIVYQGEARIYFNSEKNGIVGLWTTLPADYAGGMVGLNMAAHQATYTSIKILDLSAGAAPMTNPCFWPGATCDTSVGLCLGGPSPAPTSSPTSAPTFFENCQDPFRHPASDFCPGPVGGAVVTYDTTTMDAWEMIDQAPISENCTWSADATGLSQTSNAWGTWPTSLMLVGCMALVPDTYTDFIAEYEAVHFDNDAWGFVFGYNGMLDHWTAMTHNDEWPSNALDGISGPFTKIRKTTGLDCSASMTNTTNCYETLAYTDADGYSDAGSMRTSSPRGKEYEYTHAYRASSSWQPHKITLIVQGQEARLVYKSPDTLLDTEGATVRQGNRYQGGMTFDLKGYAGGRVGIVQSAHQMVVSNFKITDLSDPANLPTAYCAGESYCDVGVTGLCLAVAAADVCENPVGKTMFDTKDPFIFDFVDDPFINSGCSWGLGPNGFLQQASNAYRNAGVLLGCNALLKDVSYTDFVMETWLDNNDNDGVGFNFGWQSLDDHFRVYKINDVWPYPAADYVDMPHFKIQRRITGTSCDGDINASNLCYNTLGFVDLNGPMHMDMPFDAVTPAGECGYSSVYLPYDQLTDRNKMYLIVKGNQMRATYESPRSRRQVTVMNFDLSKYNYVGGRVGLYTFAHQAEFYELSVAPLSGAGAVTQFCNGDPCSTRTGRCLGSPTMSPTEQPTLSPTTMPTPNVAANEYCQGPVSATATTVVDTSDIGQFNLVDHPKITTPCVWTAGPDGLTQTSEAWGNAPGDNTLMGCMAMFTGASYTDFIAEIDVAQVDNDGWGIVFGFNSLTDHYLGIAMNDRWPLPAADGIAGPFLKIKKHNGKDVLDVMDASNVCFDTLSHLDAFGFNKDAMQGGTGVGLPKEYESDYPYLRGAAFQNSKIVMIVKGQEGRLYIPSPMVITDGPWNNMRQPQTATGVWTFDLAGYGGGQVGVFTYAHQATFSNWKITDLSDETAITGYCDGNPDLTCDNARGDASTGLCHAVPMSDVCEGPVGDSVVQIDTTVLENFEIIDDPYELSTECVWELGPDGNIRQTSNANRNLGILLGCNAIAINQTFTDVLLQVDISNDDNDAAGLNFGWKSADDHFRMHKINDIWPNPASDYVNGPGMKVKKKIPGVPCLDFEATNSTDQLCYTTMAWTDSLGTWHDSLPSGAVAPFEYARTYVPYDVFNTKRLILMIKGNKLRGMYEDADAGKFVGNFIFDLTPYDYTGGRVGFFTWAHRAAFSNFIAAPLSGPTAVTTFCNGGTCDSRTGLCTSMPTMAPTSRTGDVALADMCVGPVGGNTVTIDTTDISIFTFVDQEPLSEPCAWEIAPEGLRQTSNAWGNYPGDNTVLGCLAMIGSDVYTDFMIEVSATHDDDDAWGFVFGYDDKGVVSEHYMAMANNDKWPDPAMDSVRGPFAKIKKTNGKECIGGIMNATADNLCYDTLSYNDYLGRFVIDGEAITAVPGEIARTYPYGEDEVWPTRKMTLIVKDGAARLMVLGPERNTGTPINSFRQPTKYVSTWTYQLNDLGYVGGQLGLMVYAHQATFYDLKITDLSDPANLPTAYCNGNATCASGVCVAVPVPDVCEDPVGAVSIDLTTLDNFEYYMDDAVTSGICDWTVVDLGRGPFLYQGSNAHGWKEYVGCNALYKGGSYTDFILQFDVDNYDNDAVGFVFGWKSELEHFKAHKRIDQWPAPYDSIGGPNIKISKRVATRSCAVDPMNETNACYEAVAFADRGGVFHQAMPMDAVQPWQYASTYLPYDIGLGAADTQSRFVLMIRNNQLRMFFTPMNAPDLKVAAFAFDLSAYNYDGGKVGVYMYAHQAQFFDMKIAALSGSDAVTEFCAAGGTCNTATGLCE